MYCGDRLETGWTGLQDIDPQILIRPPSYVAKAMATSSVQPAAKKYAKLLLVRAYLDDNMGRVRLRRFRALKNLRGNHGSEGT
jgi:hypothetical protein